MKVLLKHLSGDDIEIDLPKLEFPPEVISFTDHCFIYRAKAQVFRDSRLVILKATYEETIPYKILEKELQR